ncbi:unnamed protein product [Arctogadus glacialis]
MHADFLEKSGSVSNPHVLVPHRPSLSLELTDRSSPLLTSVPHLSPCSSQAHVLKKGGFPFFSPQNWNFQKLPVKTGTRLHPEIPRDRK